VNVDRLVGVRSLAVPARGGRSIIELMVIASLGLLTVSCKPETVETTDSVNACATKLYAQYDPANKEQCVNVCLRCERGVMTTCTTSCTLKGAH
jgi:hypothetical protein